MRNKIYTSASSLTKKRVAQLESRTTMIIRPAGQAWGYQPQTPLFVDSAEHSMFTLHEQVMCLANAIQTALGGYRRV